MFGTPQIIGPIRRQHDLESAKHQIQVETHDRTLHQQGAARNEATF